ncbi:hypothetical protein TSUD_147840 [Trifolium subterraneum]|uniref:Swarming motility protein ybiA n=1 Tax=Trifolium subterraneum TaxID=3900 RepID=A0A2Z6NRV1_TRISU|nr:hypothetical protein TSUD_147840 [Trifolium subterraneum]
MSTTMEIPVFNEEDDAYWWVLCMDKYFGGMNTPEEKKMTVVAKAIRGNAILWWFCWIHRYPKVNWDTFSWEFLWHFKPEYRDVLSPSDLEGKLDLESEGGVEKMKKLDLDHKRIEGQTRCNDAVGKEEVTTFTEFVTVGKLEKNEEKPKDKERAVLKVITASINGEEEDRIKGSEPEEARLCFRSPCQFNFDANWIANEAAGEVNKRKELVVVHKPPPEPPDAATALLRRVPPPSEPPDDRAQVMALLWSPQLSEPPEMGSRGVRTPQSPAANVLQEGINLCHLSLVLSKPISISSLPKDGRVWRRKGKKGHLVRFLDLLTS